LREYFKRRELELADPEALKLPKRLGRADEIDELFEQIRNREAYIQQSVAKQTRELTVNKEKLSDAESRLAGAMDAMRRQCERLESTSQVILMGQLSVSLARDFESPLFSTRAKLSFLRHLVSGEILDAQNIRSCADSAFEGMLQLDTALQTLRRCMAESAGELRQHTTVWTVFSEVEALARKRQSSQPDVNLTFVKPSENFSFVVRRAQMNHMLLQLILNAYDALREREKGEIWVRAFRKPEGLEISIEDNGPGLGTLDERKVFTPYFTSRPSGEGLGLGLSLVAGVAKAHGGRIAVASAANPTRFVIEIPTVVRAGVQSRARWEDWPDNKEFKESAEAGKDSGGAV
jgi:two-component system, NtrC family, C4-dicarboxylate transport sensor histidine kinase DctB